MRLVNKIGLAILIGCALFMLAQVAHSETLTMLPAHVPFRADADPVREAGLFGLLVTLAAILFML